MLVVADIGIIYIIDRTHCVICIHEAHEIKMCVLSGLSYLRVSVVCDTFKDKPCSKWIVALISHIARSSAACFCHEAHISGHHRLKPTQNKTATHKKTSKRRCTHTYTDDIVVICHARMLD